MAQKQYSRSIARLVLVAGMCFTAIGLCSVSASAIDNTELLQPVAIKAAGVSCVIAETFARIFYRNAINIGLPIIECKEAAAEIQEGETVSINFDTGVITDETTGKTYQGQAFPPFMQGLIDAGGLINYVNSQEA